MMGMIFGFLGGPLLNNLLGAYKARLENASGQDKMAVELAIKEIEAEIEASWRSAWEESLRFGFGCQPRIVSPSCGRPL